MFPASRRPDNAGEQHETDTSPDDLNIRHRASSVFGDEPRNHTGNSKLRSILKRENTATTATMASASSSEGPRVRSTGDSEATPIASADQGKRDYASISTLQARDAAQPSSSTSNGAVTQDGTLESRPPQQRKERLEPRAESTERDETSGRWSAFWEKWGSVELENKGSVARDHLALGTYPPATPSLYHR